MDNSWAAIQEKEENQPWLQSPNSRSPMVSLTPRSRRSYQNQRGAATKTTRSTRTVKVPYQDRHRWGCPHHSAPLPPVPHRGRPSNLPAPVCLEDHFQVHFQGNVWKKTWKTIDLDRWIPIVNIFFDHWRINDLFNRAVESREIPPTVTNRWKRGDWETPRFHCGTSIPDVTGCVPRIAKAHVLSIDCIIPVVSKPYDQRIPKVSCATIFASWKPSTLKPPSWLVKLGLNSPIIA